MLVQKKLVRAIGVYFGRGVKFLMSLRPCYIRLATYFIMLIIAMQLILLNFGRAWNWRPIKKNC